MQSDDNSLSGLASTRVTDEPDKQNRPSHRVEDYDVSTVRAMWCAEFDHASRMAIQVVQERTQSISLLYVLGGAFIAGIGLLYKLGPAKNEFPRAAFVALLVFSGISSSGFIMRFIRLRLLYRICIVTMRTAQMRLTALAGPRAEGPPTSHAETPVIDDTERLAVATLFICLFAAASAGACFGAAAYVGSVWWQHAPELVGLASVSSWLTHLLSWLVGVAALGVHIVVYNVMIRRIPNATTMERNDSSSVSPTR